MMDPGEAVKLEIYNSFNQHRQLYKQYYIYVCGNHAISALECLTMLLAAIMVCSVATFILTTASIQYHGNPTIYGFFFHLINSCRH